MKMSKILENNQTCPEQSRLQARRGFALIYAIMVVALVSITVVTTAKLFLSDYQQTKKAIGITSAYQMAQSGIEEGIARYKAGQRDSCNVPVERTIDPAPAGTKSAGYKFKICAPDNSGFVLSIGSVNVGNEISKIGLRADINGGVITNVYHIGF